MEFVKFDVSWIFDGEDIGLEEQPYDIKRNERRLISLLPDSIRRFHLHNNGYGGKLDESVNAAIRVLVQHHAAKNDFTHLEAIQVSWLDPHRLEIYQETFEMARNAGLSVSTDGLSYWKKHWR